MPTHAWTWKLLWGRTEDKWPQRLLRFIARLIPQSIDEFVLCVARIILWLFRAAWLLPWCIIFVVLDFFIWVVYILALAGPMLFSGIYEAVLDFKIMGNFN